MLAAFRFVNGGPGTLQQRSSGSKKSLQSIGREKANSRSSLVPRFGERARRAEDDGDFGLRELIGNEVGLLASVTTEHGRKVQLGRGRAKSSRTYMIHFKSLPVAASTSLLSRITLAITSAFQALMTKGISPAAAKAK